jgi:transcriptional regulator with PAS, ATPase and Fis domain
MQQNVYDTQAYGRQPFRQMVISTPILNSSGNVQYILADVRPLYILNALHHEANQPHETRVSLPADGEDKELSIIAVSPAMQQILKLAQTVANADVAVLLTGETGTGKEVVSQYIHCTGNRKSQLMVVINCASMPESLLEAELFGYEKGAFTGASSSGKKGLFEEANGGTIFLDEINSMPLSLQGNLLRAIETKTIRRIGSTKTINVDFRLITATNEDLDELVKQRKFRLDLLYRLNVIPIVIPPLRERKGDIIPLACHFLEYFCIKHGKQKIFSPSTLDSMLAYDWPGNVRQLKNFVERSVITSVGTLIEVDNIAGIIGSGHPLISDSYTNSKEGHYFSVADDLHFQLLANGTTLEEYVENCERKYLSFVLQRYPNTYKAAAVLGTSQTSIMRRKKKYNL